MQIRKNPIGIYQIQLDDSESKSLSHCAEIANQSTDNLLVHTFKAAIALIVLCSQIKEAYNTLGK